MVLFAVPSRYFFAIGSRIVFSLGSWSTQIPAGFHVPRRTQVPHQRVRSVSPTGLSPSSARLPRRFRYQSVFSQLAGSSPCGPTTPLNAVWADPRSLAATCGISGGSLLFLISFPELLRWFTSLSLAPAAYFIQLFRCMLMHAGYPIRQSGDRRMFAPPPGFSQLTTAFFVFRLQGIHHRPVFA